jgi:hypothetical protein
MDGTSRNGERTMNVKRILALATCAALAIFATPAANASTTTTGTITVKWNTQAIGSMTMVTDYNAAGVAGSVSSTTPVILSALNGGTGACTAAGGGVPGVSTLADFGNVTPDVLQATDCMYKNAVNGVAVTSDSSGYSVATSAVIPAGFLVCLLPNGGPYTNNEAVTVSARAAAVAGITTTATTCTGAPGNGFNMAASANLISQAVATTGTNLGGDIELAIGPNAASGVQTPVVTYTLTMN